MLSHFEQRVASELADRNNTLRDITSSPGIEVVPLDDAVLNMTIELHFKKLKLSEFDRAVLAVVLIKAKKLRDSGETDIKFYEIDSDLLPFKGSLETRAALKALYDHAGVEVLSGFPLADP
jgi:hypothetical protein